MLINNYLLDLKKCMPFDEIYVYKNEITAVIPLNYITHFIFFLKKNEMNCFDSLVDICGVDYPEKKIDLKLYIFYLL